MNKRGKIVFYIGISAILTLGLSISLQSLLAAWNPPTAVPPANNVTAPIYNFSNVIQTIGGTGGLAIGSALTANSIGISGGTGPVLRIAGGGDIQIDPQVSGGSAILYNDTGVLALNTGFTAYGNLTVSGTGQLGYLILIPQSPSVGEGGELQLQGAPGMTTWAVDTLNNTFRVHHDGSVPFAIQNDNQVCINGACRSGWSALGDCISTAQVAGNPSAEANCPGGYTVVGGACGFDLDNYTNPANSRADWREEAHFTANGYFCGYANLYEVQAYVHLLEVRAQARCCR